VVVSGAGFQASAALTIGGVAAGDVVVVDASTIDGIVPALPPGTLNDIAVTNPTRAWLVQRIDSVLPRGWLSDFLDVPQADIFHGDVETIFRAGITAGCGGGNYCRNAPVTRAQMAVFLLKAEHGSQYVPPACSGVFGDVACPSLFADWIEQLAEEGITGGCGGGDYCPGNAVTRRQMAALLLKTHLGSTYAPPPATGIFEDVSLSDPFAPWIEDLYVRQITGGCQSSPRLYCPSSPNTRGQMAVFLTKTFGLGSP